MILVLNKWNWNIQYPIDIWFIKYQLNLNERKNVLFERATSNFISCNFMSQYRYDCTALPDIFPENYNMEW